MKKPRPKDLSALSDLEKEALQEAAEVQIVSQQKEFDFDIREFPVEVIYGKFTTGLDEDRAELFVPDYQRELVWTDYQQSRFIESVLLNLPIPYIFVADVASGENAGRLEIVDGSQRIRTIVRFLNDELTLEGLKRLDGLNGFTFSLLTGPRQMRLKRKTLRMIEMMGHSDEDARREMFDRLNTGGTRLEEMETRLGTQDGPFIDVIRKIAANPEFRRLCPISSAREKRREYEELVLRFFAYDDNYLNFSHSVENFLTDYLKEKNRESFSETDYIERFDKMLLFVGQYFPDGFKKNSTNMSVPRIRFEAISVGASQALKEHPDLTPPPVETWINSSDFKNHTRSDASNSRPKVKTRIEYVRDRLLGKHV
ncbi:DUF262 domain-containing protein [Deinococcus hohokamensis]|uniref:DUF262 domain-containing protein n=1 Tax=Deinococcus hohokamensis TaxID=309883 RepID=A0ABV9IE90_9DEIO